MAFKGITFAGQNVTPKDDGALYQAHYGDGILDGCSMALSGDDLVIQSGHFIAGGRVCHVDGATNVDLSGRLLSTGYIQVIMNYDLSQGEGSQWYTTFVESATTTFPALTQDDINGTDTLYQLQLAVVQISGGNLTNITSSLSYSTVIAKSTTAKGMIRPSSTSGSVVISADNGSLVFRPKGDADGTNQMALSNTGNLTVGGEITSSGNININPASGDGYLYIQENGTNAGYIRHDSSTGRFVLNNSNGGQIAMYDAGPVYVSGASHDIELRPNGGTSGRVIFGTDGQQIGGHPMVNNDDSDGTKSVSASSSSWTNLATLTGLDTSGIYLFTGKATFSPNTSTASVVSLCISTSSTSSSASYNSSVYSANSVAKYINIAMLISPASSTMRMNIQSTGVAGTAGTWYFRAVRIN